ncbi:hypothetical protein BDR04DRAFT_1139560 [Suillus decipiens]|nr:hypothetical protein BDR04DRAFT_1139560 [Suillus decipiens]
MHFAALVALVVIASTVPGLATPALIPHPLERGAIARGGGPIDGEPTRTTQPKAAHYDPGLLLMLDTRNSLGSATTAPDHPVTPQATTKRDDTTIFHNLPNEKSRLLPAEVVQDTTKREIDAGGAGSVVQL